jgi:hypothetical protein
MSSFDLLGEVDRLLHLLEEGRDPVLVCERIVALLDEDPTMESLSVPSVSMGATTSSDTWEAPDDAGTWAPDGLGGTVGGTWAADIEPSGAEKRSGLREICEGLLDGSMPTDAAVSALRAWREVRRPDARYVLGQPLGMGGMGEVLSATDVALDRQLALKVLLRSSPAARAAFVGEAKLTARLDHPGVVPVHDVGETPDGRPYFAMKRVRGRSLRELLEAGDLPGRRGRLDLFRRVCETVAFAHDRGVLHLDLKPDNVMVGAFGEVLVMDWGLAQQLEGGGATLKHVAGTPRYMAPEQATPGARLDIRADVYSLGAILYELLTERPAFPGTDRTTVLDEVRQGRFARPRAVAPDVPRELDALVVAAMATAPEQRIDSVVTLLDEVEAWLDHRPLRTVPYTAMQRLQTGMRRNQAAVRGASFAGAVALVVLVGATALYLAKLTKETQRAEAAAAEAQARHAESLITSGRLLLREHRNLQAREAYDEAVQLLQGLGVSSLQAELGRAEASWRQGPPLVLEVQGEPRSFVSHDGALYWEAKGGSSGRLHRVDGLWRVETFDHRRTPEVVGGALMWWDRSDGHTVVYDDDGEEVWRGEGSWRVREGVAYELARPRWVDLVTGEMFEGTLGEHTCPGGWDVVAGWYRCSRGGGGFGLLLVDPADGQQTHRYFSGIYSRDRKWFWSAVVGRPLVLDRDGKRRWRTDEGYPSQVRSVRDGTAVAWLVSDGRVIVRDWETSSLVAAFERPDDACEGPPGFLAHPFTLVVGCEGRIEVLARDDLPPSGEVSYSLHALASTPGGLVAYQRDDGRVVVAHEGRTKVVDELPGVRDLAFGPAGQLAVASKHLEHVGVYHPDGRSEKLEIGRPILGVTFRSDGVLGVVDELGGLHEWRDGELASTDLPGMQEHTWGIAPLAGGWAVSAYQAQGRKALWVKEGRVVAELSSSVGSSYDVAASPGEERVVIASDDGAWLWDGEHAVHLPGPLSTGAAWAATGPVSAGTDNTLRFYAPDGELLHKWALPAVSATVASAHGALSFVVTDGELARVHSVRLPSTGPQPPDPAVAAWFGAR